MGKTWYNVVKGGSKGGGVMEFQEKCPEIAGTELWNILEEKAEEDSEFLSAVGEICYQGVTLSKVVIRFFPTFTLHDATHISNVCAWMARLLGEQRRNLTKQEAACSCPPVATTSV